jgi:hypothetical protein
MRGILDVSQALQNKVKSPAACQHTEDAGWPGEGGGVAWEESAQSAKSAKSARRPATGARVVRRLGMPCMAGGVWVRKWKNIFFRFFLL